MPRPRRLDICPQGYGTTVYVVEAGYLGADQLYTNSVEVGWQRASEVFSNEVDEARLCRFPVEVRLRLRDAGTVLRRHRQAGSVPHELPGLEMARER